MAEVFVANDARSNASGVAQIVRFNWHQYAIGVSLLIVGVFFLKRTHLGVVYAALLAVAIALTALWTFGSLAASYWVYDLAKIMRLSFLRELFSESPGRWVNIHSGYDQTTDRLTEIFGQPPQCVLDLFDDKRKLEPSIVRARALQVDRADTRPARPERLPIETDSLDAVFLIFAAHELREREKRVALFRELTRVCSSGSRVVVVEHLRDIANFLAFGPGFLHFFSRRNWVEVAHAAGWRVNRAHRVTRFVAVFDLVKVGSCPAYSDSGSDSSSRIRSNEPTTAGSLSEASSSSLIRSRTLSSSRWPSSSRSSGESAATFFLSLDFFTTGPAYIRCSGSKPGAPIVTLNFSACRPLKTRLDVYNPRLVGR